MAILIDPCLAGAATWRSAVHTLGLLISASGVLLMLLTAWKSFGAAELEGQVRATEIWQAQHMIPARHAIKICASCLQILGVVLISGGALAIMGSSQHNNNMLTASLLLSLLGVLLAFEFAVEVGHPSMPP